MSSLTSKAESYRTANGNKSITNRNEFTDALKRQEQLSSIFDNTAKLTGGASAIAAKTYPRFEAFLKLRSNALGKAGTPIAIFGMGLARGLKNLRYKSQNDPCNDCVKFY